MTEASRIRNNSVFSFLSISSRLVANVVVFWIIARVYGPELFGQFTFAQTLATIFILFADFGFDILLTNEIARDRDKAKALFQQFFSLKLIFSLVALIGMWVFALVNEISFQSRILIFIFSFYMIFTVLTNFMFALYKGFERLEYETKVSMVINVGLLAITLVLVLFKSSVTSLAIAFVVTRLLGFIISLKYSYQVLKNISFRFFYGDLSKIKWKIFVYGFHLVFSYLFFQLDTILLALLKGNYEVGIYQAVFKLILVPLVIPDIFINTLMPVLARMNVQNPEHWKKIGELMNKLLFIIVLPTSIILFSFPEQIINFIYGSNKYVEAIPILRIFSVILFVRFNLETYALMLTTSDRQKIRLYGVLVTTIINFILNYFMIKKYGILGAAFVSLATNTILGLIYIYTTRPLFFKWMVNIKIIIAILFALCIGYAFMLWSTFSILFAVPIIFSCYALFAYFYFFSSEDIKLILSEKIKLFSIKLNI